MPTTNKSLVQQVYNTSTGNLPADQVVDPAYISTPYPNWSIPVNYDLGALDLALGGLVTISVTGLLVDQTMVLSQYQPMAIVFSGTLSANIKYSLPSGVGGTWAVYNNTTGAFTLSMGSPTGPTTIVIPAGGPYNVTCNSSTGIAFVNGYNAANSIATAMIQDDAVTVGKLFGTTGLTTGTYYVVLSDSPTLTGTPITTTASSYTNTNQIASAAQVYSTVTTVLQNAQTGTTYTLALSDAGKMVTLSNGSSITLSVPTNAAVAFPIGTRIDLLQIGSGQVTVAAVTPATTTIRSFGSYAKFTGQYSGATLWKQANDLWYLIGDITA